MHVFCGGATVVLTCLAEGPAVREVDRPLRVEDDTVWPLYVD